MTSRRCLPAAISHLDRTAKHIVLGNLRSALRLRRTDLAAELRRVGDISLEDFLTETGLELEDVYRRKAGGGWTGFRRLAGLDTTPACPSDEALGAAIGRLLHIDDPVRPQRLRRLTEGDASPGRPGWMLHLAWWGQVRTSGGLATISGPPTPACNDDRRSVTIGR